ncbi:MAG: 4-(cytidine 5'-diphospho)-2-C-methyl-D-erythritol kinase [Chlamydiales bacterium]
MTQTLTLFSPAKVNLFLRVLSRRPDGYHNIASLFQTIDLGDILHFTLSEEDRLTCQDSTIKCDETNLISRAVELFRQKTALKFKVQIHLEKSIPLQAGLGGGSSNAATTLWALNVLNGRIASPEDLKEWSSEIGSDIPFFFSQGTAYCTGRGERIQNLPSLPFSKTYSLVKPEESLSTPLIYKSLDLNTTSPHDPEDLLDRFYSGDPCYINDLEVPSFRLCPSLKRLKHQLLSLGCQNIFMTGSGTGLICEGGEKQGIPLRLITRSAGSWYTIEV